MHFDGRFALDRWSEGFRRFGFIALFRDGLGGWLGIAEVGRMWGF